MMTKPAHQTTWPIYRCRMTTTVSRAFSLAAVIGLIAGCSSAGGSHPAATSSASVSATRSGVALGASAAVTASSVPGCSNVAEVDRGSADPGIASLASCTLLGKSVLFTTYNTAAEQSLAAAVYASGATEGYYAEGTGYDAAADMTQGDLAGQKAVATAIVAALGGTVKHFGG
jgi:hypothetical protein